MDVLRNWFPRRCRGRGRIWAIEEESELLDFKCSLLIPRHNLKVSKVGRSLQDRERLRGSRDLVHFRYHAASDLAGLIHSSVHSFTTNHAFTPLQHEQSY
jgi:hypothetical protein